MLSDSSSQFSQAAAEIAAATAQTTERMVRQGQEAAKIGNDIASMATAVSRVAQEASDAAEHVKESDRLAQEGKEVMTNAIGAVMSLSADVTEAATVIGNLGEKSRDINAVLDMINSVAEHTNLLALNAAIEAARAGEAGRGFAVVADEVRSLAARTQESTANIKSIIQTLLASVDQAAKVINSGSDKTGECEEMVEQATITFAEIVGTVESLKTANQGISSAAEQQSAAADGVSHSMDTITSVTHGTDEDAQHISHWCDELARAADQMNIIMNSLAATYSADYDSTQR
jgi:methyl-accepting chemotaxis protein